MLRRRRESKGGVVQGLVGAGARGLYPVSTRVMWDPWGLVQMSACSVTLVMSDSFQSYRL